MLTEGSQCTSGKCFVDDDDANAANPASQPDGGAAATSSGEEPPLAPSLGGRSRGCKGQAGGGGKKAFGKA
jgi:hypothetical protein